MLVGARATIRASGPARARYGLLAGVCPASGALRASGGFWRVLGGFWRVTSVWGRLPPWKAWIETGVIEASQAIECRFLPASPWCSEINAGQPHCPARRGYRRRLSAPVVDGTGVDLAQLGQGSYAPAWAIGTVRLNRFGRGRTNVLPARALSPENRTRRASARHSAVKTAEGACERSEVLTARQCRALQSRAVFRRNAPEKM
jgi:hypothetical protein